MSEPIRFTLDGSGVEAFDGGTIRWAAHRPGPDLPHPVQQRDSRMSEPIRFTLDGSEVEAFDGETIWQAAHRLGTDLPHLCYAHEPGYRADGNCRACMVEVEGERVLAASCQRRASPGMIVHTASERATASRRMVMELLVADQPPRGAAHQHDSMLWRWAERMDVAASRFPSRPAPAPDPSHPAMRVALDACIHCNLCVRACREVQVNDVIGMAYRGAGSKIVFDFDDPMGASTCVACGECVQACPTGALMEAALVDEAGVDRRLALDEVASVCPYCGVGCQIGYQVEDNRIVAVQGRDGPANHKRLCVKGRFGFDYVTHPHRLTTPLIRRHDAPKAAGCEVDPANPLTHFREASWEEALDRAAAGLAAIRDRDGGCGAGRLRLGQGLQRGGVPRPEARAPGLRHQQRRPLHAAVPRLLGRGAARRHRLRRGHRPVHRLRGLRRHHRDRRQPHREPPGRRHLLQAGGEALDPHRHGPAGPGAQAPRHPHAPVQPLAPTSPCSTPCST